MSLNGLMHKVGAAARSKLKREAGPLEKVLKLGIGAQRVEDWIHLQLSHPAGAFLERSFQAIERVIFICQPHPGASLKIR